MNVVENAGEVHIPFCWLEEPVELTGQQRLVEIIFRTTVGKNVSGCVPFPHKETLEGKIISCIENSSFTSINSRIFGLKKRTNKNH